MATCSSVDGRAVMDHSIGTDRCCSLSQAVVHRVWQLPSSIGQTVVRNLGRQLPRSIAGRRRREGKGDISLAPTCIDGKTHESWR